MDNILIYIIIYYYMEFKWTIKFKSNETEVWANSTPKITIVVEENTEKQYKESVAIDFIGDEKVANARAVNVGDIVNVKFNLWASEYNWRYFNNVRGWRVDIEKKKPEEPVKDGGDFDF